MKIYAEVIKGELAFREDWCNDELPYGLCRQLLNRNPGLRGDWGSIMKHEWLDGVDWDAHFGKQVKPPYVPKLRRKGIVLEKDFTKVPQFARTMSSDGELEGWDEAF